MIKKIFTIFTTTEQSFQGKEPGENVILIIRQHLYTVAIPLTLIFVAALLPLVARTALAATLVREGWGGAFLFIASVWYALLWLFAFYFLTIYALNTVIVTDRRIIESEQLGFFDRKVAELHLYRVQDVSVHITGMLETFLSFGDVMVQSAASEREFLFKRVPHPEAIKDAIMKAVSTHKQETSIS